MCAKINIRNPEAFPRSPGHWSLCRKCASSQKLCISDYDTILNEQWRVCRKQHRADEQAVIWVIWILGYIELFKDPQMKCCLESSEKAEVMKCRAVISWTLTRCVWLCQTGLFGGIVSPSELRCKGTWDFWAAKPKELILIGKKRTGKWWRWTRVGSCLFFSSLHQGRAAEKCQGTWAVRQGTQSELLLVKHP